MLVVHLGMIKKEELKLINKDNADEVKKQFMSSKTFVLADFLRDYGYRNTTRTKKRTKWRPDEKREFMDNIMQLAQAGAVKEAANKFKIETSELLEMKRSAVTLIKHRLNEITTAAQAYVNYRKRAADIAKQFGVQDIDDLPRAQIEELKKVGKRKRPVKEISSKEVADILDVVKRELGEPTTIIKAQNSISYDPTLNETELAMLDALDSMDALEVIEM